MKTQQDLDKFAIHAAIGAYVLAHGELPFDIEAFVDEGSKHYEALEKIRKGISNYVDEVKHNRSLLKNMLFRYPEKRNGDYHKHLLKSIQKAVVKAIKLDMQALKLVYYDRKAKGSDDQASKDRLKRIKQVYDNHRKLLQEKHSNMPRLLYGPKDEPTKKSPSKKSPATRRHRR